MKPFPSRPDRPAGSPADLLKDDQPRNNTFRRDLIAGLRKDPPEVPCKYLYDEEGSRLFDQICELDEYFPSRTELSILDQRASEIRAALGPRCRIVEFGTGSGRKTRLLIEALEDPALYIPIDISRQHLLQAAAQLAVEYQSLEILPVCADYTAPYHLPASRSDYDRTVIFFPGSTIGNFLPDDATDFLRHARLQCGGHSFLLIGVALETDPEILRRAYNDREGLTSAFNRNLLGRAQRELDARVEPDAFAHEAIYNTAEARIEMRLVSTRMQFIEIDAERFPFPPGRAILTEYSHKYSIDGFARLAGRAGFTPLRVWTDPDHRFSLQLFESI